MSTDWPSRPFDPSDTTRVPVDDATIAAIQKVLIGWDGTNWEAVRAVLRRDGLADSVIRDMNIFQVRMFFAVGHKAIVARIGGQANTTDATITAAHVPEPLKPSGAAAYTVAAVLEMAGVSDTTWNKYAKMAGVDTPARGKRNHMYATDEVRRTLRTIIDQSSDRATKNRCREALSRL